MKTEENKNTVNNVMTNESRRGKRREGIRMGRTRTRRGRKEEGGWAGKQREANTHLLES